MLATLQLDQLLPLVGDSFSLATEQGSVHAELIQAKACSQAMKGSDREPFSLLFRLAPGV